MFVPILAAKHTDYMILGYSLAALILIVIVGSIWWRYQSLAKDEALLERLEQGEVAEAKMEPGTTADSQVNSSVQTPSRL